MSARPSGDRDALRFAKYPRYSPDSAQVDYSFVGRCTITGVTGEREETRDAARKSVKQARAAYVEKMTADERAAYDTAMSNHRRRDAR